MARLVQTTNAKDRVYKQAVSFFGTNETVLTALTRVVHGPAGACTRARRRSTR